jgi:ankyrin repeat protein
MVRGSLLHAWCLAAIGAVALAQALGASARDTRVVDAAMRGDRVAVRALLAGGADANVAQGDGMTALHWAAMNDDVELAQMLAYAGANLRAVTRIGAQTPLYLAAAQGHERAVRALLASGAAPDLATSTGVTPLMAAAAAGNPGAMTALIERGADVNAADTTIGYTALMAAAANNRVDAVRLLLARGADHSTTTKVVDLVAQRKAEAAARAAAKAKAAAPTPEVRSAPEGAKAADVTKPDVAARPDATTKPDATPPAGASGGSGGAQDDFAPAFAIDAQGGLMALHFATRQGHTAVVAALLDAGADINAISPAEHSTPLLVAAINGRFTLAKYLLERGADPNIASAAGATPLYGVINVQWAPHAFYPQPSTAQEAVTYLELMRLLLDKGADPNARLSKKLWYTGYNFDQSGVDAAGSTAFWRAAQASDLAAMQLLIAAGADPRLPSVTVGNVRLPNGRSEGAGEIPIPPGSPAVSALGIATGAGWDGNFHVNAPGGWMAAVKYLVEELGFDVNEADFRGNTPLHNAAFRGDNEMIRYLVSKGADPLAVNKSGETTVDLANGPVQRLQPYPETIALLEGMGAKNNHRCKSC